MFPGDAHPGRVVSSKGGEGDGRNGNTKSSAPAGFGGAVGGLWKWLKERGNRKNGITSTRRSWWREGLSCEAPVREIGRWY